MSVPLDFRPFPFLANPHVQTVLGAMWNGTPPARIDRAHVVPLSDGDRLVLHDSVPPRWRPGGRMALLVHGLGGSHRSGYMGRLAALLLPHGVRVFRMDLRGVGRGKALARRTYHGGCSEDVRAAAQAIHQWGPGSPLALIGLSLGGNIALKLAAEAAGFPLPNLECVAAVSPPVDLGHCASLLAQPRNRFYENHYLRALVDQVRRHERRFPDLPPIRFPQHLTMRLFDDLCTAPRWGFADALDYYRRASSLPLISRIREPTLILTARDDPFIDAAPLERLKGLAPIEVQITKHGGHLGFLGRDGAGGVRWAEQRVVEWVAGRSKGEG
jgi:predicted alpha/beta-fold hydrolase